REVEQQQPGEEQTAKDIRLISLRCSHRLCADRLFGLDASASVSQRLDQLADLLTSALVMQVHVLVEESGGTLPQAARYGEDSKRFSVHSSSPVSVWSSRLRSAPLMIQSACRSVHLHCQ